MPWKVCSGQDAFIKILLFKIGEIYDIEKTELMPFQIYF